MSDSTTGLYRIRNTLVIDPAVAEFPDRCIFTNQPVNEHRRIKLANAQAVGANSILVVEKDECYLNIPVCDAWFERKNTRWLRFA